MGPCTRRAIADQPKDLSYVVRRNRLASDKFRVQVCDLRSLRDQLGAARQQAVSGLPAVGTASGPEGATRASARYDSPGLRPACGVRATTANVALHRCVATSFPKKRDGIEWSKLEVLRDIGLGNYGTVKLVKDPQGQVFAVKHQEMHEDHDKDWCRQEVAALRSCNSPFITQMKGFREQQHCVDIALEFCAGGDLQALYDVQTGVLKYGSQQHSQFYMACAAMALQHLHEKRFIYRDLKPENLLVDGAGCCKLCDMGHAKQVTREPRFQT